MTYQIDILNPKAAKLLQNLADLNLITIKPADNSFLQSVNRFRAKAIINPPTLKEITKEVESVRTKRYKKTNG